MKKPNSEMFRLVRFAIRFPDSWHTFTSKVRRDLKRAEEHGLLDIDWKTKQFRLKREYDNE